MCKGPILQINIIYIRLLWNKEQSFYYIKGGIKLNLVHKTHAFVIILSENALYSSLN